MTTKELLKKIRVLEVKTRGITREVFSGEYHAAFKGRGMTFSEVRPYQLGDEPRTIDWNVTARLNNPYVKVFDEERELNMMLILDLSASTFYGTNQKTKKNLVLEIAAVLIFSAIANNDKVGAIFVTDEVELYIKPAKGRKHGLFILRELIDFQPKNKGTNISKGLSLFRNTQRKRSIGFIIGDFQQEDDFFNNVENINRRHDMVAIKVYDRGEQVLPKGKRYVKLQNAENDKAVWVDTRSESFRKNYQKMFLKNEKDLVDKFRKVGVDYKTIHTGEDYLKQLILLLKRKHK